MLMDRCRFDEVLITKMLLGFEPEQFKPIQTNAGKEIVTKQNQFKKGEFVSLEKFNVDDGELLSHF